MWRIGKVGGIHFVWPRLIEAFRLRFAYENGGNVGHRLDSFGDLLQYGTYQVIKGGTSSGKDEEREVCLPLPFSYSLVWWG